MKDAKLRRAFHHVRLVGHQVPICKCSKRKRKHRHTNNQRIVPKYLYMIYKCRFMSSKLSTLTNITKYFVDISLQWRHNGHDDVSNHQPHDYLLNRIFRRRSKKVSKLRVTGLCAGYSLVTGEFAAHMASNEENVSIWWRHPLCPWPTDVF